MPGSRNLCLLSILLKFIAYCFSVKLRMALMSSDMLRVAKMSYIPQVLCAGQSVLRPIRLDDPGEAELHYALAICTPIGYSENT